MNKNNKHCIDSTYHCNIIKHLKFHYLNYKQYSIEDPLATGSSVTLEFEIQDMDAFGSTRLSHKTVCWKRSRECGCKCHWCTHNSGIRKSLNYRRSQFVNSLAGRVFLPYSTPPSRNVCDNGAKPKEIHQISTHHHGRIDVRQSGRKFTFYCCLISGEQGNVLGAESRMNYFFREEGGHFCNHLPRRNPLTFNIGVERVIPPERKRFFFRPQDIQLWGRQTHTIFFRI